MLALKMTKRSSSSEWSGSSMTLALGSPNTVLASTKATPCFRSLEAALTGSHSNPLFPSEIILPLYVLHQYQVKIALKFGRLLLGDVLDVLDVPGTRGARGPTAGGMRAAAAHLLPP